MISGARVQALVCQAPISVATGNDHPALLAGLRGPRLWRCFLVLFPARSLVLARLISFGLARDRWRSRSSQSTFPSSIGVYPAGAAARRAGTRSPPRTRRPRDRWPRRCNRQFATDLTTRRRHGSAATSLRLL